MGVFPQSHVQSAQIFFGFGVCGVSRQGCFEPTFSLCWLALPCRGFRVDCRLVQNWDREQPTVPARAPLPARPRVYQAPATGCSAFWHHPVSLSELHGYPHLQPTPQYGAVIPRGGTQVEKAEPPQRGALGIPPDQLALPSSNTNFSSGPLSPNVGAIDSRLRIALDFDDSDGGVRRILREPCKPRGNVVLHEVHLLSRGEKAR